jgi:hypothetical protein
LADDTQDKLEDDHSASGIPQLVDFPRRYYQPK